jgi:peptidoglycan/xylan/chitin deacetylase (PgdA/CDA1 family)
MPLAVLCYHGVVEQITHPILERNFTLAAQFKEEMAYLRRRFTLVGLPDLERDPGETDAVRVAITVDDGHANNLLVHALLSDLRIPWTVFIPTAGVGSQIWTTELALLVLAGRAGSMAALGQDWRLGSDDQRAAAYQAIRAGLKTLPAAERRAALDALRAQAPDAADLLGRYPAMGSLTWDEIIALHRQGVGVGSHGAAHEIQHARQPEAVQVTELHASKAILEAKLGSPCDYFALPNGDSNPATPRLIREAGYRLGFTVAGRLVSGADDRCLLPRLSFEKFCRLIEPGAREP